MIKCKKSTHFPSIYPPISDSLSIAGKWANFKHWFSKPLVFGRSGWSSAVFRVIEDYKEIIDKDAGEPVYRWISMDMVVPKRTGFFL